MIEYLIQYIEWGAIHAHSWGYLIIFILMAIESSFLPLPSEVVMIPAGFLIFRGELTAGNPFTDFTICVIMGALGSIAGACFNYYFAFFLGRPFLYKFGKYFFISNHTLGRAEELFREYGDITTFVCRLIPAIRHLISLPAGLARMNLKRFYFFTGLGAGIWCAILTGIGYYLGSLAKDMTYRDLVHRGIFILHHNYILLFSSLVAIIFIYVIIHKKVMGSIGKDDKTSLEVLNYD